MKVEQPELVSSVEGGEPLVHLAALLGELSGDAGTVQHGAEVAGEHLPVALLQRHEVAVITQQLRHQQLQPVVQRQGVGGTLGYNIGLETYAVILGFR